MKDRSYYIVVSPEDLRTLFDVRRINNALSLTWLGILGILYLDTAGIYQDFLSGLDVKTIVTKHSCFPVTVRYYKRAIKHEQQAEGPDQLPSGRSYNTLPRLERE